MAAPSNEELERARDRGRAAWPGVEIEPTRLAAFLAARPSSHLEDQYLACACADGDPAALAAFEAKILPGIAASLRRLALPADVAAEVHQRVRAHLLVGEPPRIAEYQGRGPLPPPPSFRTGAEPPLISALDPYDEPEYEAPARPSLPVMPTRSSSQATVVKPVPPPPFQIGKLVKPTT